MDIIGFLAAATPITLSPGASFTLAMHNAVVGGMGGVRRVITGTALGMLTHGILGGIGIAGLLFHYPSLTHTITLLGTAYLIFLALRLIYSGWYVSNERVTTQQQAGITTAYLANVLNIKAVLFYISVVPLFAGVTHSTLSLTQGLSNYLLLTVLHALLMAGWLTVASQLLLQSAVRLPPRHLKRIINLGGGALLLGLTLWPFFKG